MTDPLPAWLQVPAHLEIEVRLGPCPDDLPDATVFPPHTWTTPTRTLLHVSGGWRALVEDGRRITVQGPVGDPALDPTGDIVGPTWILDGWALPFALLQRGLLPLHATIVDVGGTVVAVGGHSGSGKSTTALALAARGHVLLTDDIAAVELRDDGPWVLPFQRRIHLFPHSADALGLADALVPMAGQPHKGAVLPPEPPPQPRRLGAVILLDPRADVTEVSTCAEQGHARLGLLLDRAGRPRSASATLGAQRYFDVATVVAARTPIWRLVRPVDGWTADAVCAAVEQIAADPTAG